MSRPKISFACQGCGYKNPKWMGRCPECHEFNTMVEEVEAAPEPHARPRLSDDAPVSILDVQTTDRPRLVTKIGELDRVFGGGIVLGSVNLIGGDPGIGKSTLILQVCDRLARQDRTVLYVSAEESVMQTRLRAERLKAGAPKLMVVSETNVETILRHIDEVKPAFVVVDSIQMVYKPALPSAPGTVGQVRECAADFVYLAKRTGVSVFIVGHVTKDGAIAGPRTLEHLVDGVFYFEGDRYQSFRILRGVKNRFGSTNEVGIFEMTGAGLSEIANPSELFLSSDRTDRPGSAVTASEVGSRVLLVEIQGLTTENQAPFPTRRVTGVDPNRLAMILAVLTRRVGISVGADNVYVNAVGGVQLEEPACDLAIAAAITSSSIGRPVAARVAVVGEIGLGGEVRGVTQIGLRVQEAARLGFEAAVIPADNSRGLEAPPKFRVIPVKTVRQALEELEVL